MPLAGPPHSPRGLYYRHEQGWKPLPEWGQRLLGLGQWAVRTRSDEARVVALAVPSRGFAASLVGTGAVLAAVPIQSESPDDPDAYFEMLATLPAGTPVTLREGVRKKRGILLGVRNHNGAPVLRVQVEHSRGGGLTHALPPSLSLRVQPLAKDLTAGDLPKSQKGRKVVRRTDLLESLLPGLSAFEYAQRSQMHCVIVGNARLLRSDIAKTEIGARRPRRHAIRSGYFQDILRVRRFLPPSTDYKCEVLPVLKDSTEDEEVRQAPLVLFDGAEGYLRWRHIWPQADWLVMLDRTARSFDDGVAGLVQEWTRRADDLTGEDFLIPAGVEALGYVRRSH